MTTRTDTHHRTARKFYWSLLIGATLVSLLGNIVHAILPYVPHVAVQIGCAAVPPVVLLCTVEGIGLAVRAGASGRVYRLAVAAVAAIGAGAFALSYLALRDLALSIGYSRSVAWLLPMIVDTAVATSALMLVALGDKPASRTRIPAVSAPVNPPSVRTGPALTAASALDRHFATAQALVDAGSTTKTVAVVASILSAHANGTVPNRIASDTGVHHKTIARILNAAEKRRHLIAA